jgi:hypothetical protein
MLRRIVPARLSCRQQSGQRDDVLRAPDGSRLAADGFACARAGDLTS